MSSFAPGAGKTHWQRYRILYVALCVAVALLLFFFPSEERIVSHPVLAVAKPAPGFSVMATLEANSLGGSRDESISFESSSGPGTRVDNMLVCINAPEFTPEPASGCTAVKVYNKGDVAQPRSPASIRLTPNKSSGNVKILITATWIRYVPRPQDLSRQKTGAKQSPIQCANDPALCSPIAEKVAMTLGPVNLGINRLSRFAGRVSSFLKDLTLPIILILLANWLARQAAERDRRRDDKEKELRGEKEAKQELEGQMRRRVEREQEEEKQISHILLPKVMRLAGNYYLPLTLHASKFVLVSTDGRTSCEELAFYMFSFFHVARALKEKEGGVFFKEMAAEQMFKITNNTIRWFVVTTVGGEKQFNECLDHMETWLPPGERRWPRLSERPAEVPQGWTDLERALVSLDQAKFEAIRYLFNVLAETMHFESNAPYVHWYNNSEAENVFSLAQRIPDPPDDVFGPQFAGDFKEFRRLLSVYITGKGRQP